MPYSSSFPAASASAYNNLNQPTVMSAAHADRGNQTAIGSYAFTYDGESRMATGQISGATTTYFYDGDGRRVMKQTGTASPTYYVYDAFGNLASEYGGTVTAPPCTTCYVSVDHLGSMRVLTDSSGSVKERHDYMPFGDEMFAGTGTRTAAMGYLINTPGQAGGPKFTGQYRDPEMGGTSAMADGLDFFGARYMSSAQGRFTSPDPLGAGAGREGDPQSWNLYAYGRNNPLKYVDPLGLTYQVCDNDGHCSNLDDATFESERKSGSKSGEYFSGGKLFHYDANGNKVSDGTFAHTDIDSTNGPALVGELGRRADAQIQFIGVFAGASVAVGATGGAPANLLGLTSGSGLSTLDSAAPYFRYTAGQLNELIGGSQRELLKQLFGQGEKGALSRLSNLDIPQGLTKETLEIYKEAAIRVVQRGPGAPDFQVQQL